MEKLPEFMAASDVLVSPRIKGVNTPMKIYSYLQAGKPILATDIISHSQVLSSDFAFLVSPHPAAFAAAMRQLASDPKLRNRLADEALSVAQTRFSPETFDKVVFGFCDQLTEVLTQNRVVDPSSGFN